eukprot:gene26673-35348_t
MDQNDRKLILCDGIVPLCFPDEDLCCVLHFWSDKYREKERDTILEEYHAIVKRPEGTFDLNLDTETLYLIEKLSKLPREKCSRCLGCRQVYCGPCGLRMPNAEELLPARVELPFDVLLLLHWQESLVKCTGITAAPLSTMDSVRYELWAKEKTPEDWNRLVGALHPDRDVLLFPDRDAVVASEFQWGNRSDIAQSLASLSLASSTAEKQSEVQSGMPTTGRKWRLVILEGSWNYAKTMAWQIIAYRKERHLPPLPCVILKDLTGEYWRFHHEGHSAVSTIEAIAHTALAAGLSTPQFDDLLLLFRLQKWRVMRSVRDGGKVPKAVEEALIEADKHAQYLHYELALRYYSEVACFQSTSIANQYYNNAGVCLAKNGKLIEAFDCMRMACELDPSNSKTVENMVLISILAQHFDMAVSSFKQLCQLEDRTKSTSSQSEGVGQELTYINSLLLHSLVEANLLYEAHKLKEYLSKNTSVMVGIPTSTIIVPEGAKSKDNMEYNRICYGANSPSVESNSVIVFESPCSRSSRLKRETLLQAKQQFDVVLDNLVAPTSTTSTISNTTKGYDSVATSAPSPLQCKFIAPMNVRATVMNYPECERRKPLNLHINVSKSDHLLMKNDMPAGVNGDNEKAALSAHIYRSQSAMVSEGRLHTISNGVEGLLRTHGATSAPHVTCDATSPATISTMSQSNFGTPTARYSARLIETVNHIAGSRISDETQWLTFRHGRQTPSPDYNDRTKHHSPTILSPNTLSDNKVFPRNSYATCSIASEDSQSYMGCGLLSASKETSTNCSGADESIVQCSPPPRQLESTSSSPPWDHSKSPLLPIAMNPSSTHSEGLQITANCPHSAIQATKTGGHSINDKEKHWQMDGYEDFPLHPNLRKGSSWTAEKSVGAVVNEIQARVKHGHTLQGRTEYLFLKESDSTGNGRKTLCSSRSLSVSAPNTPANRNSRDELHTPTTGEVFTSTNTHCNSKYFPTNTTTVASLSLQSPSPITHSSENRSINAGKDLKSLGSVGVITYDLDNEGRLVDHHPRSKRTASSSLSVSKADYKPSSPLEQTDFGHSGSDGSRKQLPDDRSSSRWPALDEISNSRPPRLGKALPGLHNDRPQLNEPHPTVQSLADTVFHYKDILSSNTYKNEYLDYDVVHRHVRENFLGGPLSQEDVDPSATMGSFDIVVEEASACQQSRSWCCGEGLHPERLLIAPSRKPLHHSSSPRFFKYEQLVYPGPYPAGIQLSNRELYLSDADFKHFLGVSKEQWNRLPKWRRILKKRERKLF